MAERPDVHNDLMALAKRRGFLQPSFEIYGGLGGFYDYGPLGAQMKRNIEAMWRELFVLREGMAEIECPTLAPEPVWKASGHLDRFTDTVVECPGCGTGLRGDHLVRGELKRISDTAQPVLVKHKAGALAQAFATSLETLRLQSERDPSTSSLRAILVDSRVEKDDGHVHLAFREGKLAVTVGGKRVHSDQVLCAACGKPLDVLTARIAPFNLMFRTPVGTGSNRPVYLRPETAQGMFVNFDWAYRHFREKLPFGVVQLGRAYRNEISPRQGVLRLREFSQMEAEVFVDPQDKTWPRFAELKDRELTLLIAGQEKTQRLRTGDAVRKGIIANEALGYFLALTDEFLSAAGIPEDILRFRQHGKEEKAHYSTDTWDAEFSSPRFGWVELVGIADRTDYDLQAHSGVSGVDLQAFRRFDAPREVEHDKVIPKAAKLGPRFKSEATAVAKALEALDPSHAKGGSSVFVTVEGERVEVPAECFEVRRIRERADGEFYTPHVIEPSYGVDRILYAVLEASMVPPAGERDWTTLKLPARIAPVTCGVFPLMARDGLDEHARGLERELRDAGLHALYDDSGNIGRRYARMDEVGTPWCVTVDYETLEGKGVTVRERDSGRQVRVPREGIAAFIRGLVAGTASLAGYPEVRAAT